MGQMTLSKLQTEQYKEIVEKFKKENPICLGREDCVRLGDVLTLLQKQGYIETLKIDNCYAFQKLVDFSHFDAWHKDREDEERKLNTREWKIGIIGALIGLIPFLVTTVLPWILAQIK
jgi:hypothetical protein